MNPRTLADFRVVSFLPTLSRLHSTYHQPSTLFHQSAHLNTVPISLEIICVMAKQIEFSPAMPIPLVFDIQGRIQVLHDCLDPKHPLYQPEQQHVNIKAVIKLYEDKKIDGIQEVYIMEGKVVTKEEARNRPGCAWAWREVRLFILFYFFFQTPYFYQDLSNK